MVFFFKVPYEDSHPFARSNKLLAEEEGESLMVDVTKEDIIKEGWLDHKV